VDAEAQRLFQQVGLHCTYLSSLLLCCPSSVTCHPSAADLLSLSY
jgi:hypothetical protein